MRIHSIAHIKRYKVNTQIPDYVLYKTLAIGDVRQSNFGQWQTSSLEVEWSSQKWTRAESVVLHHLDRPIPICADDDIIIRDYGIGRTVCRRRAVTQVAHPWSGGIPSWGRAQQIPRMASSCYSPNLLSVVPWPVWQEEEYIGQMASGWQWQDALRNKQSCLHWTKDSG